VNAILKAALACTASLLLAAVSFVFIIAPHPESNLLLRGLAISAVLGIAIGIVPYVAHRRRVAGRGVLDVFLTGGLVGTAIFLLYFEQLKGLYQQGAFHATLAAGWVAGTLLVISYDYSRKAAMERKQQ
jgi:hypothetical protein